MIFFYKKIFVAFDESSNSLGSAEKLIEPQKNWNYIIKEDFKYSIAQWQCKKKIDKLIKNLQNKI